MEGVDEGKERIARKERGEAKESVERVTAGLITIHRPSKSKKCA